MANISGRGLNRSGRFTSDLVTAAKDLTIIRAGTERVRIHNSGKADFVVKPEGSTTPTGEQITLFKKSSVDINLNGSDVLITQAANTAVEGLYEYIDPQNPIRSGRFKAAGGANVVITQGMAQKLYRILNSGDEDFTVTVNGNLRATVKPRRSIDLVAKNHRVVISAAAKFQGIYDILDRRSETRSGRFKIKVNTNVAQPIINLVDSNSTAWYRIFNSGENLFKIIEGTTETDLEKGQSIDLQFSPMEVSVRSAQANEPIEGIYDFIR